MKKVLWFVFFVYLVNIITYFGIWRNKVLENIDSIRNNPETLKLYEDKGLSMDEFKRSALSVDYDIFNPFFNISYSIGHVKMIIVSVIIALLITYWFTKKPTLVVNKDSID
jgi:hypothetical protein